MITVRSILALTAPFFAIGSYGVRKACWKTGNGTDCVDFVGINNTCNKLMSREYIISRIDPGEVGSVTSLNLVPGKTHLRITRAKHPPIFEIPDFLTDFECKHLINTATTMGLEESGILGTDGVVMNKKNGRTTRKSQNTFLQQHMDPVVRFIQQRVAALAHISGEILDESEGIQVVGYGVGGHYNSHWDSSHVDRHFFMMRPCCHQVPFPHTLSSCHTCRYITVLFYLNDVEEGGETIFPFADKGNETVLNIPNVKENCFEAPVVVKPKKGTAVMWYNHMRDPETGWTGVVDINSLHAGCPVLKGEKWIANVWISVPQYKRRYDKSIYAYRWM